MLISAFVLGVLGSFHCIGMCGPIAFMLPVDRTNSIRKITQITVYHIGRLLAYSLIGLVFGLIGRSLFIFGFQQQLSIIIGVLMIGFILIPQHKLNQYSISKPIYKLISKIKSALGSALKRKSPDTFLTIGFLNGFLPCGLVYMAIFGAISEGNALYGSLYMTLFGLGTIPLMTTAIYASHFLKGAARQKIQNAIPVFVVIIGILFILRGLGLGIPYVSPTPVQELVTNGINCH
ncbi:sulfite exporter TauE/SafE family protein [Seonamhaeicola sediminis]|uniref:Sulfite exporter TauE/SafE family protein n=1 Tax=Seonamhaeicola sediminis TaxID=2528206 RepID=A0A562YC63_9FLAO|nr:sulfite exporter TauE/SafE family protein [Seonamhaeicola sediminis]TWO31990.1 sulfite exporter TauE/SafE family protein [Seonamhaeicola sediminis]